MDDEGVEVYIIETGKKDGGVSAVLEIVKNRVMQKNKNEQRDLQFPILVRDQDRAGDEREEVHLEEPVHLIDILSHENAQDDAQYILIKIGTRKRQFDGVIGDEAKASNSQRDGIGVVVVSEVQADGEECGQKIVHEPVGSLPDAGVKDSRLSLQVGGR